VASAALVEQVRALFGPKMDAVERELVAHLDQCPQHLRDHARGVLRRGGKRLRPILHLLCADLLGYKGDRDVLYATVFEYVHVASLLHDDVIDEADTRRGSPSLNRQLGNTLSVLVGDYLCVKALSLAALAGDLDITAVVSKTTIDLVEGESLQELQSGRLDVTPDEALRVIELKTGRLMAAACETAAMLAGEPEGSPHREKLREFGLQLGLAFQLVDDVLDFSSDAETLGKPVLSDLRGGKLTLPAIHARERGGPEALRILTTVIEDGDFSRVSASEVLALVTDSGGLAAAQAMARTAAARARAALVGLPPGQSLDALAVATEYAVTRKF
jgi:octaprenyl-diphosphate synthase